MKVFVSSIWLGHPVEKKSVSCELLSNINERAKFLFPALFFVNKKVYTNANPTGEYYFLSYLCHNSSHELYTKYHYFGYV